MRQEVEKIQVIHTVFRKCTKQPRFVYFWWRVDRFNQAVAYRTSLAHSVVFPDDNLIKKNEDSRKISSRTPINVIGGPIFRIQTPRFWRSYFLFEFLFAAAWTSPDAGTGLRHTAHNVSVGVEVYDPKKNGMSRIQSENSERVG